MNYHKRKVLNKNRKLHRKNFNVLKAEIETSISTKDKHEEIVSLIIGTMRLIETNRYRAEV